MSFLGSAMWVLYKGPFARSLAAHLPGERDAASIARAARRDYDAILAALPPFEKGDPFKVNIASCAMLVAFLKNVEREHTLEEVTDFYRDAMDTACTRFFCAHSNDHTARGQAALARSARLSMGYTSPYSWKFTFEAGPGPNRYTTTFLTCGICRLMADYGFERYTPAMCALDYTMAEMGGSAFSRTYTLASGGPYCDCHYEHLG